jgi:hypothetical protein
MSPRLPRSRVLLSGAAILCATTLAILLFTPSERRGSAQYPGKTSATVFAAGSALAELGFTDSGAALMTAGERMRERDLQEAMRRGDVVRVSLDFAKFPRLQATPPQQGVSDVAERFFLRLARAGSPNLILIRPQPNPNTPQGLEAFFRGISQFEADALVDEALRDQPQSDSYE